MATEAFLNLSENLLTMCVSAFQFGLFSPVTTWRRSLSYISHEYAMTTWDGSERKGISPIQDLVQIQIQYSTYYDLTAHIICKCHETFISSLNFISATGSKLKIEHN